VIQFLLGTDVADMVEDRIWAARPEDPAYPHLTVLKVSERDVRHWFSLCTIQLMAWSSRGLVEPRATARDICETAVAALHDAANVEVGDAVLGACTVLQGPVPNYDQPTGNPRFRADVLVPYHPAPAAS
jgi:hypothetical protein